MQRMMLDIFFLCESEHYADECYLIRPQDAEPVKRLLKALCPRLCETSASTVMQTAAGIIHQGDLLAIEDKSTSTVGILVMCIRGTVRSSDTPTYCAVVQTCAQRSATTWRPTGELGIVEYVNLRAPLPYVEVEDGLRPLKLLGFSC